MPAEQQARLDRAMSAPLPTCCAYHGFRDGCREGKDCPERRPLPIMFDKPERAEQTEAQEKRDVPPYTLASIVRASLKLGGVVAAVCFFAYVLAMAH